MKKLMTLLIAASIVAALTVQAEAGRRTKPRRVERTVEAAYKTPAAAIMTPEGVRGVCWPGEALGCVNFYAEMNEGFATIQIEDGSGQTVHAIVEDAMSEVPLAEFCSATDESVFLEGATIIRVWLLPDPCPNGTPSVPSQGTVSVTFSNLP